MILLLDANFPEGHLIRVLHKLSLESSPKDDQSISLTMAISSAVVADLNDLYRKLDTLEILKGQCVISPQISRKGHKALLRAGFQEHYRNCGSGYVYEDIPDNDTGWVNIISGKSREYGFKSVAVFQTSDNRKETFEDLETSTTWGEWATPKPRKEKYGF